MPETKNACLASFAIGVQALDLFTTEGKPELGDDAGGGCYIDPLPGQQVPDELKDQIGKKIDFINVGLVNILTNPLVVSISFFMNITYGVVYRRIALFILEVLAFFVEGYIYDKFLSFKKYNGFTISFVLNILSFGLGILINKIIY